MNKISRTTILTLFVAIAMTFAQCDASQRHPAPAAKAKTTAKVPAKAASKAAAKPAEQNAAPKAQAKPGTQQIVTVDSKMGRGIKNTVVLPASYSNSQKRYPTLYLLHGAWGTYQDWPQKADLNALASKYDIIIVCPDGQDSWYFDSPIDPTFQFETYVSKELREYIDSHFRTIDSPDKRAITGLSMGGHGALWLALRHPDIYGSCGSMSGGVDIYNFPDKWKIDKRLGPWAKNKQRWRQHSVANLVNNLKGTDQNIIIDDGDRDIFIKENNALHKALQAKGIKHDYSVRPGVHDWKYWVASLNIHLDFFNRCFKGEKHPQVTK